MGESQRIHLVAMVVPTKNSKSGEKSRVLGFIAMMSPAWVVPQDLLASQKRPVNLWRIEPIRLFSKTWFAPRRPSFRTSSSRLSGYARPFRFAKEFGPDQVLMSDTHDSG